MTGGRLIELYSRHPVVSDDFADWMASEDVSIVLIAGGHAWVVGRDTHDRVHVADVNLAQPMSAMCPTPGGLIVGGWQIWRLVDALDEGQSTPEGHDSLLLPQSAVTIGDVGVSDLAQTAEGLMFSSTRLGCLARPDDRWSFTVAWTPPWQTAVADEDRCHVGGFTFGSDGRTWVAVAGRTDTPGGWKAGRVGGGCVVSTDGETLCDGLTMPRSPRPHGAGLLIANAGGGALVWAEVQGGGSEEIGRWPAACSAVGVHDFTAVVGLSSPVGTDYAGLPDFEGGDVRPNDGLVLLDLHTGRERGTMDLMGRGIGIASIVVLPGVRWAAIAPPRGPDARSMVVLGPADLL